MSGVRRHLFSVVILAALMQAGCKLLPDTAVLRVFTLPVGEGVAMAADTWPSTLSLRVRSLQANQILSGNRIVVMPQANEISIYRGVRWSDPAPVLIRDRLLEVFLQSNALGAVFNEDNRLQSDVELSGILHAFHSEYIQGRPWVHIQADLYLTDPGGRQLLASRRFEVREESKSESIEDIVASFGRAADAFSGQVLNWTLSEMGRSHTLKPHTLEPNARRDKTSPVGTDQKAGKSLL